jgi:hypothetical protein
MKNNWDETTRVFIQVEVWLEWSLDQLGGGETGRGHVRLQEKAVGGGVTEFGILRRCVTEVPHRRAQ